MHYRVSAAFCAAIAAVLSGAAAPDSHVGYSPRGFERQRALEQRLRDSVSAERLSAYHAAVTRQPHLAGTDGARVVADYITESLKAAGLDVRVSEYRAYLSFARSISIDIQSPVAEPLRVAEPPSDLDPDTKNRELGPGFVAYSASGDVTSPVVYVNYGLPRDYAQLSARGVDLRGKIALARYGKSHRAVKVHTAQREGAAGLIIYSDPADDGFVRGETWPNGYWRTPDLLQRGNAKYSWFWHGDPLTPGVAATAGAPRLDASQAPTLPRIPVAVLSWGEARKILTRIGGIEAPPEFQGGIQLDDGGSGQRYRTGPSDLQVRLRVQMDNSLRTIRDIVGRVPGVRLPNRGVLLGTHHDAWTFGGVDPATGTASLLELARALGALRRQGWQPQRTISIAFWDAEEFGLIGSTEYAEEHRRELQDETICYINTDLYTNGPLDAGGVPTLRDVVAEATMDVRDGPATVYDRWPTKDLKALGSGADFVPFQDHLGLPTLSIEFNATGGYSYGPYHSNYDTRRFVERVADPGFRRGVQLVQLLGTLALRIGESEVLPFRYSRYAITMREQVRALPEPGRSALSDRVDRVARSAETLEGEIDRRLASGQLPSSASKLNDLLARLEQRLLDQDAGSERTRPTRGDRDWYRHLIYGWDIYSLYDGQMFPRLAEALRGGDPNQVTLEVARITAALDRLDNGLREALALTMH